VAISVDERTPEREQDGPPDWARVAEAAPPRLHRSLAILARGLIAVALAAVLWVLGRHTPAVVLVAVATVLTGASLVSPSVAAAIDSAVDFVQRWAGRGLALLLLGTLQILVFTPLWLILRLVRANPLAMGGSSADDESFWRPVPRGSPRLYRRPFAYERIPRAVKGGDRLPLPRLRAMLGLVALLILLDVGIGAAVDALSGGGSAPNASNAGGLAGQDVPAAAHEPWRVRLGAEINQVWNNKRYDPYLGWTMPDVHGRYVNVEHGVRHSYEPIIAGQPVTIGFMGGSTMFGLYQRDGHTIPSEFARLAAADGIPVRVVNYGRLAYVNWQETLLLEQLASRGSAPDLAVFYDGFNEVLGQFQLGPHAQPTHLEAQQVNARLGLGQRGSIKLESDESLPAAAGRAWADTSLVHQLGRELGLWAKPVKPGQPTSIWPGDQTKQTERRGAYAASIDARGVDLARRLARSYGFETAFFWQPFLYSKRVANGEEQLEGWLGADADSWTRANDAARARLDPAVVDLSKVLDGVRQPVMYDFVHTNELGARVIARALYERLRPQLERLSREAQL
jgi:lysophospholipase L1-like esterase